MRKSNRLDLIGEDDKIFNLHLLMAFNFILYLAGRISLSLIMLSTERNKVAYPTYVSRCLTLRAQCLSFMQIGQYRRIEDKRRHHKDKDHEYYFNKFEWLSAFERFHVPCLVELSLGFICGK
ncbi:hypothetical protein T08_14215 [Trichinella sp. T8]|nr:hypothetical protein T08_14215 [Trichinella sp. T8]